MADPFSVAAGSIGIIVPALHGARLLLEDLKKIADAPKAVQELTGDVDSLCASLSLLKDIEETAWTDLGDGVTNQSHSTISACGTACDEIRGDVHRWTKRSKGGTLSWRDRLNIGFFKEGQLTAHVQRLQSYKLTLATVIGTATLYSSVRHNGWTEDLRRAIIDQQNCITAATGATGLEIAAVTHTLEDLQTTTNAPASYSHDDMDDLDTTTNILEELIDVLKSSHTLLQQLASASEEKIVAKAATANATNNTVTFGANNSGMQQGIVHGSVTWNVNKG